MWSRGKNWHFLWTHSLCLVARIDQLWYQTQSSAKRDVLTSFVKNPLLVVCIVLQFNHQHFYFFFQQMIDKQTTLRNMHFNKWLPTSLICRCGKLVCSSKKRYIIYYKAFLTHENPQICTELYFKLFDDMSNKVIFCCFTSFFCFTIFVYIKQYLTMHFAAGKQKCLIWQLIRVFGLEKLSE